MFPMQTGSGTASTALTLQAGDSKIEITSKHLEFSNLIAQQGPRHHVNTPQSSFSCFPS